LNFSDIDLKDYVVRNLNGADIMVGQYMDLFCANLKQLTGSHTGFCYAIISYLNEVLCASERKYGTLTAEKVFGMPAARSQENPSSLEDLVYTIVSSIDYNHIQSSLGKTKKTGILLERAWQMEFYRTSVRCTCDFVTSADVGELFGSTGEIDFTIHSLDMKVLWGIELLREGTSLDDHVSRFEDGGRYEIMCRKFTDSCVLDIRQQPNGGAKLDLKDLGKYDNLFIFTYDDTFSAGNWYSNSLKEGKVVYFNQFHDSEYN
jgi:hypothetical protein